MIRNINEIYKMCLSRDMFYNPHNQTKVDFILKYSSIN